MSPDPTSHVMDAGLGESVALITDGRSSSGIRGYRLLAIS